MCLLTEAGTRDYLIKAWEGTDIPQPANVETMVLTAGQIISFLFIVAATFGCSILVFCCEVGHKTLQKFKEEQAQKLPKVQLQGKFTNNSTERQICKTDG